MDDRPEESNAVSDTGPGEESNGNTKSSRRRRVVLLTGASLALAVGFYFGYVLAYTGNQGGFAGGIGVMVLGLMLVVAIGLTLVVGLIATAFRRSRGFGKGTVVAAGILVVGVLAGFALTPVLGLEYREPVTLLARGTASARFDGDGAFAVAEPGSAKCRSEPGADSMTSMEIDLGRIENGRLRGSVSISEPGTTEAWVELRVDSVADVDGVFQPEWLGTSEVTELEAQGASGRVSFEELRRGTETGPPPDAASDPWPSTLSGSLSWACSRR